MHDADIPALARAIYRDKVRRAQAMTLEERLLSGGPLFESASAVTCAGIRAQHPEWTSQQVRAELRRRMAWAKRREYERGQLEVK